MLQVIELLRNVSIFETLSDEVLTDMAKRTKTQDFAKGSVVVQKDDPGDAVYFVSAGTLKAVLSGDGGREIVLSVFREGDFFGEMSLLDGQPRSATIVAVENSTLVTLKRRDFVNHVINFPQTAINILTEMSMRLRKADEVIGNLALLDVYSRLSIKLREIAQNEGEKIELTQEDGETVETGILLPIRPTHQELASMIGASRETVSRAMGDFQRQNLVSLNGQGLILLPLFFSKMPKRG